MSQLVSIQEAQWSPEQLKLITDVIARNASPDELKLFLYRCKNMGLDPLKPGQIHFVKYSNGPGTIVVGIEGFRTVAHRSGKLSGIKRGAIRDEKGNLVGAWAEVYRTDWQHPAREEAPLSEYNTGRGPWQKMPETMIKKVAEAAALRMAFPDSLGGVYTNEEMEQAESAPKRVAPEQPGPDDGIQNHQTEGRMIDVGSWKKYRLHEVPVPELRKVKERLESKTNPNIDEQRLLIDINEYLVTLENLDPEDLEDEAPARRACDCGSDLKLSERKGVYYCPNFKDDSKAHIKPIPIAEYEAIK